MNKEVTRLIEEFALFDDWEEKYSFIIELGNNLPKLDYSQRNPLNKISGCVSQVWLTFKESNNKFYFFADSDALIVKGLLAIVIRIYSGKTTSEIQDMNFTEIFIKLDLKMHLTPSRSNGLFAVINKIKKISHNRSRLKDCSKFFHSELK